MKKIISTLCAISMLASSLYAEIEFAGVFYLGGEGSFSLINSETGAKSGWVRIGQFFEGYQLESHDREKELLRLVSPGESLQLGLRGVVVQAEKIVIRGEFETGIEKEISIEDAAIPVGEESRFPIADGAWVWITPTQLDNGQLRYDMRVEEEGENGETVIRSTPRVITNSDRGFSFSSDELNFSFEPKRNGS